MHSILIEFDVHIIVIDVKIPALPPVQLLVNPLSLPLCDLISH